MSGTSGYKRQHGLTLLQRNAVDLLVTGKTDREAAETVGVNRVTMTKWRLYDPWFQAELNRRRLDVWGSSVERLRAMLPKALGVLERALDGDDAYAAAVQIVKLAALDKLPPPDGPTDGDRIVSAMVEARANAKRAERRKYRTTTDELLELDDPKLMKQRDLVDVTTARDEVLAEIGAQLADDPDEDPATPSDDVSS